MKMSTQKRNLSEIKYEINRMIEDRRATRLINPVLTLFYLKECDRTGKRPVKYDKVKDGYENTVCDLIRNHLHHNFNIGGQFNDSYLQRLSSRHHILNHIRGKEFAITRDYAQNRKHLISYISLRIAEHLRSKLGNLLILHRIISSEGRDELKEILEDKTSRSLREFLERGFSSSYAAFLHMAYGFEISMFAILKVLLAKFGCRIYRDSKTYSTDKGTDIATNFGVAYQIKKKSITNEIVFKELLNELLLNFADGRIQEGNVFLIVEDADDGFRKKLESEHINCLTKNTVTGFLDKLTPNEKWDILKHMVQEFKRELISDVCRTCKRPQKRECAHSL